MKKCKSCEFENKDDARFCVKCGAALDKRCSGCGNILDEDEVYCPVCGARTDGKRVCPSCRALNKPQSVFCSTCGTPLVRIQPPANKAATKAAHVPPPPVAAMQNGVPMAAPKEKGYAKQAALRILNIVRASAVLAFALLMFIMSFFSVQKIEAPDLGDDLNLGGITEIIEVNVTPIDIIEGSFARLDPKTQTEVAKDFMKYLLNDLSDREKKIINGVINGSSSANYMEALDLIKSKLESYNVLKFAAVEEVTEFTPSTTFNLWLSSAYALLYIGVAAAFLVLAILDFINTLRKKENRFKPLMTLNALGAAAALGYAFLLKMLFEGSMGFGLTSVLVFALLSMLLNIGYRIFAGDIHFEKAKLPLYISTGVGAVFSLLMLFFAGSSVMRLFCEYTSGSMSKSFRGGYGAFDLAGAWDALKISADDPTILGSAAKYIPQAFMSYNGELLRIALSPSMMGILGDMQIEVVLTILGILINLISAAFVVTLALSFVDHIQAIGKERSTKLVYGILNVCFAVVLLALTIVYAVLVNKTMEVFENIEYTVSVSGLLIAAVVISVIDLVQRIVCKSLSNKKTPDPAPVPTENQGF